LNKPAHYLTHTDGSDRPDLMSFLDQSPSLTNALTPLQPLHRLDLGTSGLICFASSPQGLKRWQRFWQDQRVEKRYLGLVTGVMRPKGIIKRTLKDQRRKKSLEATTRYKTIWRFDNCSLVEFRPQEGRKHQIRRHLQMMGYALSGENRYRARTKSKSLANAPDRLWLHAHRLTFQPKKGKSLPPSFGSWTAPLADELKAHLLALGGEEIVARLENAYS
jgi:23S rRNA-/tRNA-specific pseudouridylate synthase